MLGSTCLKVSLFAVAVGGTAPCYGQAPTASDPRNCDGDPAFEAALADVLVREGKWSDRPNDEPTMNGITLRMWSKFMGRQMTKDELKAIAPSQTREFYCEVVWDRPWMSELPAAVRYIVWDAAVLAGERQAVLWLQTALAMPSAQRDGYLGPATVDLANAADTPGLLDQYERVRHAGLDAVLKRQPHKEEYRNGWTTRTLDVTKTAKIIYASASRK